MPSSLFSQMNPTAATSQSNELASQIGSIKQMAKTLSSQPNPTGILQMASQQNPQLAQVMNLVNGSGMSAKQLFMTAAQQRGMDPTQIVNMLK